MKSSTNVRNKTNPAVFSRIPYTADCPVFRIIHNFLLELGSGLKLTKSCNMRIGSVHDDVICN